MNITDVDATVEAVRKTNRDIKNYSWMANMVTKQDVEYYIKSPVAQGGIDSVMPKAGGISDDTYGAVRKKLRADERNERFAQQVANLENAVSKLDDEKERMVVEGCMDNLTLTEVGQVLGVSKQAALQIKESAVRKLAIELYLA